jgi:hypothetical protein
MATRSFIARYNPDTNDYTAIYCHWDGYPEGVGVTLRDHYTTDEKVKFLIDNGDISSLRDTVVETAEDSYKNRGDRNTDSRTFKTLDEMMDYYRHMWCEYGYLWESDATWYGFKVGNRPDRFPNGRPFINLYTIKETQNV